MIVCGQNGGQEYLILTIHGRERVLSEKELIEILEKHFDEDLKTISEEENVQVKKVPIEGEWFEVHPLYIDRNLFRKKRQEEKQEQIRQLILEAFIEVEKNPEKYARTFKTLMPNKDWRLRTVEDLKKMAVKLGDHNADWVEQALEWAQRINNGEPWRTVCNCHDTAAYFRLVIWKDGHARCIGGSRNIHNNNPPTHVSVNDYEDNNFVSYTLPLVVRYK